jgi:hypothetical protein
MRGNVGGGGGGQAGKRGASGKPGALSGKPAAAVPIGGSTSAASASASVLCDVLRGAVGDDGVRRAATLQTWAVAATARAALRLCHGAGGDELGRAPALADAALGVLAAALRYNAHPQLIDALLCSWRRLSRKFATSLFVDETAILGDVCDVVVALMEWPEPALRARASALFLALAEDCQRVAPNFARLRLQSSIAVSRLAGVRGRERRDECAEAASDARALYPTDFALLTGSLQAVRDASSARANAASSTIAALIDRLFTVTECMAEMRAAAWDYDKTVDLMNSMAHSFADTPDLKVTWLENLARYHEQQRRLEEAAQVTLLAAAHVSEALRRLGRVREYRRTARALTTTTSTTTTTTPSESGATSLWGAKHSRNIAAELTLPSAATLQQMSGN